MLAVAIAKESRTGLDFSHTVAHPTFNNNLQLVYVYLDSNSPGYVQAGSTAVWRSPLGSSRAVQGRCGEPLPDARR